MRGKKLDLTGKRFGKLVVLGELPERKRGYVCWACKCDCGSEKVYSTAALTSRSIKNTRSCGCLWKKPAGASAQHRALRNYIRNATTRSIEWHLSEDQFGALTQADCHYCGRKPTNVCSDRESNGSFIYNGIDRKDDGQGYIWDNVVSCCKACNWAKGKMTYSEFMSYLRQLVHYHNEKGTFIPLFRIASTRGV